MRSYRFRTLAGLSTALCLLVNAGLAAANELRNEGGPPAANQTAVQNYATAQFVTVALGPATSEQGVHLVTGQPDGLTEPSQNGGRRSIAGAGTDRWFYFDVHDSYINGGLNKVMLTIAYEDKGLTPIFLEYDAFDTVNPTSTADSITKKRLILANRSDTGAVKTVRVTLEDARLENHQAGPADFRVGSTDELVLRNVSVLRMSHEKPQPPIRVVLDNKEVIFDVPPAIAPTGSTLVPMRALFVALGVPADNIYYNPANRTVRATKGNTVLVLTIDSDKALVGNQEKRLNQAPVIQNDRTLIPLRFVSEEFGLTVQWNDALRVITLISMEHSPAPVEAPPSAPGETGAQP